MSEKMTHTTLAMLDSIEINLSEIIATYLESESIKLDEAIGLIPHNQDEELHLKMAKAAMIVYKKKIRQ